MVDSFFGIVGKNEKMLHLFNIVKKVAPTDSTVLITGESGTGKELFAKAIHKMSGRSKGKLVPVNCSAIPRELLETELFGYEKGAFTGAVQRKMGRFELANHGTIFLDEIGDMDPYLQAKVLRAIQEKVIERLGGTQPIKVDVRVIAATNRDLEKEVEEGRFRKDLFFRLNVIPLKIPPLRERKDDIPLLFETFVEKFNRKSGGNIKGISDNAMKLMMSYSWPVNVRELENLIERVVILKRDGILDVEDLPEGIRSFGEDTSKDVTHIEGENFFEKVRAFERKLIIDALKKSLGVKSKAAKLLGIKRTTLIEKMKRLGIEADIIKKR